MEPNNFQVNISSFIEPAVIFLSLKCTFLFLTFSHICTVFQNFLVQKTQGLSKDAANCPSTSSHDDSSSCGEVRHHLNPAPNEESNADSDSEDTTSSQESNDDSNSENSTNSEESNGDSNSEGSTSSEEIPRGHPGDESDDPGDSGDSGDSDGNNDDDESESDPDNDMEFGQRNFSLEDERLDAVLQVAEGRTAREAVAMVLALSVRNNLSYDTTVKVFKIISALFENSPLPVTKDQLWSVLNRTWAGIRKHVYCSQCFRLLGLLTEVPNPVVCQCGWTISRAKAKYFITLNVRNQLEKILSQPGIWEKLQYPQNRRRRNEESMEDIYDSEGYRRLRGMDGGPASPLDFTYTFNMDGFKVSKSSKSEAMPIFMRINELPPNLRQKNILLAGLWLDKDCTNFNIFMKVFTKQANKLSSIGVTWRPNGVDPEVSRFFPTCCCADAKGRAQIMNMALYSGNFGCTFCDHRGIYLEGSMKYPIPGTVVRRVRVHRHQEYVEEVVIQEAEIRTDAVIRDLMVQAGVGGRRIRGVIGPTQLMLMQFFDLGNGFSTDDLHPLFKGVTNFHTELLLQGVPGVYQVGPNGRAIINRRLKNILTPSHISRKPRSLELMHMWKASEWRNWLLYYAVPCLQGIIPDQYVRHLGLLSKAVFLLSRDVIREEDLLEAARCLELYVTQFQEFYGPENMRFNIHILGHIIQCIRLWGAFWCHSTFPYESWNHRLGKCVSSPRGAIDQIVLRFLLFLMIEGISINPLISQEIRDFIATHLLGSRMRDADDVGGAHFFGQRTRRHASVAEIQILAEEGYAAEELEGLELTEYFQVKVNGMECRSVQYRHDSMSNNSFVYTNDDQFGVVESIVVLDMPNNIGGVFVTTYEVGDGVLGVNHIVPILNDQAGVSFFPISEIHNLAVKMGVREQWCIAPMANQLEID